MIIITGELVDPSALYGNLGTSGAGSVLFHYAVVKSQAGDRPSDGIRFERAGDMEAELSAIESEMRHRWNLEDVLLVRRLGVLDVGDIISLVAVSSPASLDAFEACRHGLERLKTMKTLKKTERITNRERS